MGPERLKAKKSRYCCETNMTVFLMFLSAAHYNFKSYLNPADDPARESVLTLF